MSQNHEQENSEQECNDDCSVETQPNDYVSCVCVLFFEIRTNEQIFIRS